MVVLRTVYDCRTAMTRPNRGDDGRRSTNPLSSLEATPIDSFPQIYQSQRTKIVFVLVQARSCARYNARSSGTAACPPQGCGYQLRRANSKTHTEERRPGN